MANVPIVSKDGVRIATAHVDDIDVERISSRRWYLNKEGYAYTVLCINLRKYWQSLHRHVLGLVPGEKRLVDHIDGDRLNCRRSNLRFATAAQNAQNIRKTRASSSRFLCVTWNKRAAKWQASVKLNGRSHYLGLFDSEDAAGARAASFRAKQMPFSKEAA